MTAEMHEDVAPLADVRAHLSSYVDSAVRTHQRVTITKNGKPAAILMGVSDYESLIETLDILSEPGALEEIRQARQEAAEGKGVPLEQVLRDMGRADLIR